MKPCMGGFCTRREKCAHYVSPTNRTYPAERLCAPGAEVEMFFVPLKAPAPIKEAEAA